MYENNKDKQYTYIHIYVNRKENTVERWLYKTTTTTTYQKHHHKTISIKYINTHIHPTHIIPNNKQTNKQTKHTNNPIPTIFTIYNRLLQI